MQCCECCGFFDDRALSGPPRVLTTVSSSSNHIRAAVDVLDPNLQAVISHQRIHASMRASSQPSRAGTQLACPIRARPSWPRRAPDAAGSRRTRMQMAPETVGAAAAGPDAVGAAWLQLKQFTEAEFRGRAQQYLGSAASRALLRDALLLAYRHPCPEESWAPGADPDVLLGVVASDSRLAVRALRDWCGALGLRFVAPDCKVTGASSVAGVQGAVYIKYNALSRACYLTQYQGADRGVLVQLGPGRLLGHFPLGFWDEGMQNSEPGLAQQSQQQQQQGSAAGALASGGSWGLGAAP